MSRAFILVKTRMKIMIRNPFLIVLCVVLPFVFYGITLQIMASNKAGLKVPIALVDFDKSRSSERVIENIKQNDSFECIITEKKSAIKLLKKEEVQGVYILLEDFEENIKRNKIDELVEVFVIAGNKVAPAMTDIIAGEIVPLVCVNKGASFTEKYYIKNNDPRSDNIKNDTLELIKDKINERKYELPINIKVKLPKDNLNKEFKVSKDSFFIQWILGMFLIFLSLYLVFNCTSIIKERKNNIKSRILISGSKYIEIILGDLLGLVFLGTALNIIQILLFYLVIDVTKSNLFFIFLINLAYTYCIANILLLLTKFFKNTVSFQSFMPMFVLFLGLIGGCFFSLDILPKSIKKISVLMPTYWAHNALNKAVLYDVGISSIYGNVLILTIYGTVFLFLNFLFEEKQF